MNILDLFPVPVGQAELGRSLTEDEMNFIHEMKNDLRDNNTSNRITWNQYVLDEEPLKQLKHDLEFFVRKYFHHVWQPESDDVDVYITCSWLTWTDKGDHHHTHSHPNSFISGTFYVSAGPEDAVFFPNDRISPRPSNILIPYGDNVNMYNCADFAEPTRTNQIKLFPSELQHYVRSKNDDHLRICLAFNTWIKGMIGEKMTSTELQL